MFRTAAAALLALLITGPAMADATPAAPASQPFADPSCPKLAEVEAILTKNHENFVVLDANDILSIATETPAHIIVSTVGQVVTLGYESAGCVLGPLGLAKILPKHDI